MPRVLVVADIQLFLEGLRDLLLRQPGIEVVAALSNVDAALAHVTAQPPDFVLIDLATPDSLLLVRTLAAQHPEVAVVMLGLPDRDDELLRCAEAGVAGYVPREASLAELVATIETTVRGELRCSPRAAAVLLRRVASLAATAPAVPTAASLTDRELEIARFLDQGMSNKDIARQLGIETSTVKNHVHNLLSKLQVHRRAEAGQLLRPQARWHRGRPGAADFTPRT